MFPNSLSKAHDNNGRILEFPWEWFKPNLTFLFGPHLDVSFPNMYPYKKILLKFKTNQ